MTMPLPQRPDQITLRWYEDDDGSLWGEVVELPGCFVSGSDLAELEQALFEAVRLYLSNAGYSVAVTLKRREDAYREERFEFV